MPPALLDGYRHFYREGARGRPETLTIDGVHPWHTPASPLPNIPATKAGVQVIIDQMTLGCLTNQTGDTKEYDVDGTCLNHWVVAE